MASYPRAYHCIICHESVEILSAEQPGFDPCALILVTNADKKREHQREQIFYCHAECFRKTANDDTILYFLEPDSTPIGEGWKEEATTERLLEEVLDHIDLERVRHEVLTRLLERPKGVWYPLHEFPLDERLTELALVLQEHWESGVVLMWGEEVHPRERVLMAATDGWHDKIVSCRIDR